MNWEDSNACTPLKRDFLRLWFAEEQRFFLTGGSALALFYLDHRRSYDLDLFTSDEVEGIRPHRIKSPIQSHITCFIAITLLAVSGAFGRTWTNADGKIRKRRRSNPFLSVIIRSNRGRKFLPHPNVA